jgi:hypothetical protein
MPGGIVEQPAVNSAVIASERPALNIADFIGFLFLPSAEAS